MIYKKEKAEKHWFILDEHGCKNSHIYEYVNFIRIITNTCILHICVHTYISKLHLYIKYMYTHTYINVL